MAAEDSVSSIRRHAVVVYNPVNAPLDRLRTLVAEAERSAGWAPSQWYATEAEDSGTRAARMALGTHPAVIIVVGGDGTVRAVADEARGTDVPLALVPVGTGNLLARNLGLERGEPERSIHVAFTGSNRRIDVGVAAFERDDRTTDTHAFVVMAGIGLDARMATGTDSGLKRRIGWLAYTDPIARSVMGNRQLRMHYTIDGAARRSMRAHTVIVGNCGTLTANILLLPDAVVDDGLLDVVVLRPKGFWGWARIGSRLALNRSLRMTRVGRMALRVAPAIRALQYVQARELGVRFDVPEQVQLDGDGFGAAIGVELTAMPGGLTICVP